MKRIALVIFFITLIISADAQIRHVKNLPTFDYKRLHFGFTVGINTMDFILQNSTEFLASNGDSGFATDTVYGVDVIKRPGFHLGPVSDLRLGQYLNLRFLINISFGQRDLEYRRLKDPAAPDPQFETHLMEIESIFVEFPLQIKYRSQRLNNHRPYLIAGINPKIDMAARKKIKEEEKPKIRLNRFDCYAELGVGVDFYLPYFKFSTELKFAYGLRNMVVPDGSQYTSIIDQLHSQMFVLSFHFE